MRSIVLNHYFSDKHTNRLCPTVLCAGVTSGLQRCRTYRLFGEVLLIKLSHKIQSCFHMMLA